MSEKGINLKGLPVGTKLIWDAPEPYPGYGRNPKKPGRVFYTAIVLEQQPERKRTRISTGAANNWMSYETEHLRLPTEQELVEENWEIQK